MAIAYVTRVDNDTSAANPLSLTPSATAHDVLIAGVVNDTSTATTFTWGSGGSALTEVKRQLTTADGQNLGVAIKNDATGSEGAISITPSADALLGFIARYSGCDNTTPQDVAADVVNNNTATSSAWTIDSNSITPVTAGAWIVCIMGSDDTVGGNDVHTFSTVSGSTGAWNVRADLCDTGFSSFRNIAIADAPWTSGSVVVRGTGTLGGHSAGRSMVTMVLRPSGGAPAHTRGGAYFANWGGITSFGSTGQGPY